MEPVVVRQHTLNTCAWQFAGVYSRVSTLRDAEDTPTGKMHMTQVLLHVDPHAFQRILTYVGSVLHHHYNT
jgi:hypothetical protein